MIEQLPVLNGEAECLVLDVINENRLTGALNGASIEAKSLLVSGLVGASGAIEGMGQLVLECKHRCGRQLLAEVEGLKLYFGVSGDCTGHLIFDVAQF